MQPDWVCLKVGYLNDFTGPIQTMFHAQLWRHLREKLRYDMGHMICGPFKRRHDGTPEFGGYVF